MKETRGRFCILHTFTLCLTFGKEADADALTEMQVSEGDGTIPLHYISGLIFCDSQFSSTLLQGWDSSTGFEKRYSGGSNAARPPQSTYVCNS